MLPSEEQSRVYFPGATKDPYAFKKLLEVSLVIPRGKRDFLPCHPSSVPHELPSKGYACPWIGWEQVVPSQLEGDMEGSIPNLS